MIGYQQTIKMKKLLAIIVLSLCFITSSQADDIRDFQIEGMSIGDSALDFFSKERIKNKNKIDYPSSDRFYGISLAEGKDGGGLYSLRIPHHLEIRDRFC